MIVDIPFVYRIRHVPKGHRKPVWASVLDRMPVQIEEIDEKDAPLAFRSPRAPGFGEHPHPLIHLAPGGRLLAPLYGTAVGSPDNAAVTATRGTVAAVVRLPVDRRNPFADLQNGGHAQGFEATPGIEAFAGSREMLESDRDERIARISRRAAEFCFVGDTLCLPTDEPVWHAIAGDGFAAVVLRRHPMPPERMWPGAAAYRADRFEAALAHARRMATARGIDPASVRTDDALTILVPEAVRFDDEAHALAEAAREGVKWRLKEGHPELDAQMAQFDLAIAAGRGNEDTARAVEELVAWLDETGLGEHAERLREFVERREALPQTAARREADLDLALEQLSRAEPK